MASPDICVISNTEIRGQCVVVMAGFAVVRADRRNFLGKASILLRLAGEESLANVPGIYAPVNFDTKSIRANVMGFDVEKFLSGIRFSPRRFKDKTEWQRQVLGAMVIFGREVTKFSSAYLGVDLSEVTEAHRSLGQTGKLLTPVADGPWFSANDIDPKGLRWKRPSIYTSHRV
jgi:hypothetical protein